MVARGASARLQLVGHLGWVHQHEARPVGQPRERMMLQLATAYHFPLCHVAHPGMGDVA